MRSANISQYELQKLREDTRQSDILKETLNDQEKALDIISPPINIQNTLNKSTHLSKHQKSSLSKLLYKHEEIFDGSLGVMSGGDYHINLKEDTPRSIQKR